MSKRGIRKPYVSRYARDAEILRGQKRIHATPVPEVVETQAGNVENAPILKEAEVTSVVEIPTTERVDADEALRRFDAFLERRFKEVDQYMENVVAEARRQVFRGKER